MDSFDRGKSLFFAELSDQTKRYQDMAKEMGNVAKTWGELRADEKLWLAIGYNNLMKPRINSWRILSSKMVEDSHNVIREYREKVEFEMSSICRDILGILDIHLIPSCKPKEDPTAAFYYLMKGDYNTYLAQFVTGTHKEEPANNAFQAYQFAMNIELPHTHPIRLALAFNFANFQYEIIGSLDNACKIAKKAYDEAKSELPSLIEEPHKDSVKLMNLIPERIKQWEAKSQKLGINTNHRAMASSSSSSSSSDRAKAGFFAMLAEQTERYEDMVEEMIKVAKAEKELREDERLLLSGGCKNVIERLRASRIILTMKMVEDSVNTHRIREYRKKVDAEITQICNDVILVLDQHLIPFCKHTQDPVGAAFYYMIKGDYISCVADLKFGKDRKVTADKALVVYESARSISRANLPPKHPIRMGVAFNFSIFYRVILGLPDVACTIATEAYDDAINCGFDRLNEEQSNQFLKLLPENIKVWDDLCKEIHVVLNRAPAA